MEYDNFSEESFMKILEDKIKKYETHHIMIKIDLIRIFKDSNIMSFFDKINYIYKTFKQNLFFELNTEDKIVLNCEDFKKILSKIVNLLSLSEIEINDVFFIMKPKMNIYESSQEDYFNQYIMTWLSSIPILIGGIIVKNIRYSF